MHMHTLTPSHLCNIMQVSLCEHARLASHGGLDGPRLRGTRSRRGRGGGIGTSGMCTAAARVSLSSSEDSSSSGIGVGTACELEATSPAALRVIDGIVSIDSRALTLLRFQRIPPSLGVLTSWRFGTSWLSSASSATAMGDSSASFASTTPLQALGIERGRRFDNAGARTSTDPPDCR